MPLRGIYIDECTYLYNQFHTFINRIDRIILIRIKLILRDFFGIEKSEGDNHNRIDVQ